MSTKLDKTCWNTGTQFLQELMSLGSIPVEHALKKFLIQHFQLLEYQLFFHHPNQKITINLSNLEKTTLSSTLPFLTELTKRIPTSVTQSESQDSSWIFFPTPDDKLLILFLPRKQLFPSEEQQQLYFFLLSWLQNKTHQDLRQKYGKLQASLGIIRKVSSEVSASHQLKDLFHHILTSAISLVDAEKGHIMRYNKEANELQMEVVYGMASPEIDKKINEGLIPMAGIHPGEGVQGKVFLENQPLKLDSQEHLDEIEIDTHSILCVPLCMNNEVNGVLYVTNKKKHLPFKEEDLDILTILATNAAALIDQDNLRQLSITDPLTKLYTRRYFDPHLLKELRRASRHNRPLAILAIDADHFKHINDTFGHQAGDEVLKVIADIMRQGTRKDVDTASRFGGEEFFIILPETDEAGAFVVAERIRSQMEAVSIPWEGQKITITLSLGISLFPEQAHSPKDLIKFADEALYEAKTTGRNKVCLYQKPNDTI